MGSMHGPDDTHRASTVRHRTTRRVRSLTAVVGAAGLVLTGVFAGLADAATTHAATSGATSPASTTGSTSTTSTTAGSATQTTTTPTTTAPTASSGRSTVTSGAS